MARPCFSRSFNNWKLEDFGECFALLHGKRVIPWKDDALVLKESKDGNFFCQSSL